MSTIRMDSATALSGAIRSSLLGSDISLTLRDDYGNVLYSAFVDRWSTDSYETTVKLLPIAERIESAVGMHAAVKRAELTQDAKEKGLL